LGHPEAEAIFPVCLANGKRHVLVVLASDQYGKVLDRIKKFRGPVNVAIGEEGKLSVITFSPHDPPDQDFDECAVSPTSEIGLLLALLRQTRRPTRVNLVTSQYDAELIDQGAGALAEL